MFWRVYRLNNHSSNPNPTHRFTGRRHNRVFQNHDIFPCLGVAWSCVILPGLAWSCFVGVFGYFQKSEGCPARMAPILSSIQYLPNFSLSATQPPPPPGMLLIGPSGTNCGVMLIEIYTFSSTKMHLKISMCYPLDSLLYKYLIMQ